MAAKEKGIAAASAARRRLAAAAVALVFAVGAAGCSLPEEPHAETPTVSPTTAASASDVSASDAAEEIPSVPTIEQLWQEETGKVAAQMQEWYLKNIMSFQHMSRLIVPEDDPGVPAFTSAFLVVDPETYMPTYSTEDSLINIPQAMVDYITKMEKYDVDSISDASSIPSIINELAEECGITISENEIIFDDILPSADSEPNNVVYTITNRTDKCVYDPNYYTYIVLEERTFDSKNVRYVFHIDDNYDTDSEKQFEIYRAPGSALAFLNNMKFPQANVLTCMPGRYYSYIERAIIDGVEREVVRIQRKQVFYRFSILFDGREEFAELCELADQIANSI